VLKRSNINVPNTSQVKKNISQVIVLSVGSAEEDHAGLTDIFSNSQWSLCPQSQWELETSRSLDTALPILRQKQVPIVICERDLEGASWKALLEQAALLPDPPYLIVASRLADEYLWAEALNLGAYDVLAKPFETGEVVRVLSSAWLHRQNRRPLTAKGTLPTQRPQVRVNSRSAVA
jgi:DNA-binding NtrC family response regulator